MTKRNVDLLLGLALAAAAIFVWHYRIIVPADEDVRLFGASDFFLQIYPMWTRASAWLRAGTLPLWNPYQMCGHPFFANAMYGLLYPPNWLHLVLPTEVAIEAVIVVGFILTGLFTYAYARNVVGRADAAFVTAMIFMLSGFMLLEASWFPPAAASAVWLPLALLAIDRIADGRGNSWVAILAAAIALSFLGGWAQTWLYTLYVVVAYAVARLISLLARPESRRAAAATALRLAGAAVLVALLIAPQLVPTLELQSLGTRHTGGLTLAQALTPGVVHPERLLQNALDSRPGKPRYAYLGMTALLLMPLSWLAATPRWRVVCLWALAIFALCVAVSLHTPLFTIYRMIGGASFRGPARILYIYAFAGAVLAGLGFATAAEAAGTYRGRWIAGTVLAVAGASLGLVMPWESRVYVFIGAALLVGGVALPWVSVRRVLLAAVALLILVELVTAVRNPYRRPIHGTEALDRNAAAFAFIKERQGLDRTYIATAFDVAEVMPKQGTLREIYSVTDYEPFSLARYGRFFRAIEAPDHRRPDNLTFTGGLRATPSWPGFALLDLLSVRYVGVMKLSIADQVALRRRGWRVELLPKDGDVVVYGNRAPLPRAYVTSGVQVAESEEQALAAITRDGFDARATVVLEKAAPGATSPSAAPAAPLRAAEITTYQPSRVVVQADTPTAGYLVLTDTFYPGWRATVDGHHAPVFRANYLFRAVAVEAGRHEVVFTYKPWSVAVGLLLGLGGIVTALALCASDAAIRRRRLPHAEQT